jgi:hypothetical protein
MSDSRAERTVPVTHAIAAALSLLIAFVGVVHEVVDAQLYPNGPAPFGGPVPGRVVGVAGAAGLALFASTLGLMRFPVRGPAAGVAAGRLFITAHDLTTGRGFHSSRRR